MLVASDNSSYENSMTDQTDFRSVNIIDGDLEGILLDVFVEDKKATHLKIK